MKVLLQNRDSAFDKWGGDTTQMVRTGEELRKLGVEVYISLDPEPNLAGYDLVHVFNIQTAPYSVRQVRNAKKHGLPVALSTIYWEKQHMLRSDDYLLYHSVRQVRSLARFSKSLARLAVTLHRSAGQAQMCEMLESANILLPNSIAELEILAVTLSMPELRAKTVVVPNGVDIEELPEMESSTQAIIDSLPEKYLMQVANFDPGKNQLNLLRAMTSLPDIPVVFVGRGAETEYGRACRSLGKERGNVFFVEHVPHEQIGWLYKDAKVHVLPSLRESPGLATLEAAVHGANCVVSIHGPVTEYFQDDVWYCDPLNLESINKAVAEAWAAPYSPRLRERILQEFTWAKAAECTLEGYKRVLGT